MKKNLFVILFFLCFACTNSTKPQIQFYTWLFDEITDSLSNQQLVFFISDQMCAECMNVEFENLKHTVFPVKPLIVGVFDNQRNFRATVRQISTICRTKYIDIANCPVRQLPPYPFYFVYEENSEQPVELFLPEACNPDSTRRYYERVILLQSSKTQQNNKNP